MELYKISPDNTEKLFKDLGCDAGGVKILSKKAKLHILFIKNIHVGAANILKQDTLSIGADLAIPKGTILGEKKYVDAILIANERHLNILEKKELSQPFGLKDFAKQLKNFIHTNKNKKIEIMGVLNANNDSFYQNSRFLPSQASLKIEQMIEDGANIIDIGAVSSRPGSEAVSDKEEFSRLKQIIDTIYSNKYYEKIDFSIDSYSPLVTNYVLDKGFKIINDIKGLSNNKICEIAAKYNAKVIIMHMQKDPKNMQKDPKYNNLILDIDNFFKERIEKAKSYGINDIVLDVGIGFGKTLNHNLLLLKNLEHFQHFNYDLLIGASRKSMIEKIVPNTPISERLPGTLSIHLESINHGASIIRCHDVKEHVQAIRVQEAIRNII